MATQAAVVQLDVQDGQDVDTSMEAVREAIATVRGVDFVLLPEVWTPGYFAFNDYRTAAGQAEAIRTFMANLARDFRLVLHGGSIIEEDNGQLFNTSLLFDTSGSILSRYRKIHLFGYESLESQFLASGDQVTVVETPLGKVGMAVCYDLRFPEQFTSMVESGAEIISIPAAWPAARGDAWSTFLKVRALENQCYVIAANSVGTATGGVELFGHSAVIHPSGETIATAAQEPTVVVGALDIEEVVQERNRFPVLADRRPLAQDHTLYFERRGESPLRFSVNRVILAAYTARDQDAVQNYIAKLAAEGIPPPTEVPSFFPMGSELVTTAASMDVVGSETCGEAEYVLLLDNDEIYVAVGSDHTDRAFERDSIHLSKQMCPKPISRKVWRYSEVADHWDSLILTSTTPENGPAYQHATVSNLIHPDRLLDLIRARFADLPSGTIIFSGSVSSLDGGFRFEDSFVASLLDPKSGDELSLSYRVRDVTATRSDRAEART